MREQKEVQPAEVREIEELNSLEEDVSLFEQVHFYTESLPKVKYHSFEEDRALAARVRQGDLEARSEFFYSVARMVVNEAKKRGNAREDLIMELIGAGNFVLWTKGIDAYDPDKGAKFITYATQLVKYTQNKALRKAQRSYDLTATDDAKISRVASASSKFLVRQGREPTVEELKEMTNLPAEEIIFALSMVDLKTYSLQETIGDHENYLLEDFVPDPHDDEKYFAGIQASEIAELINAELLKLDARDKDERKSGKPSRFGEVLRLRLGIGEDGTVQEPTGPIEIAKKFGLTRERIRQIETVAVRRVKDPKINRLLAKMLFKTRGKK